MLAILLKKLGEGKPQKLQSLFELKIAKMCKIQFIKSQKELTGPGEFRGSGGKHNTSTANVLHALHQYHLSWTGSTYQFAP